MPAEKEVKLVLSAEDTTLSKSIDAANDELSDFASNAVTSANKASKGMSDAFESIESSSKKTADSIQKENKDIEQSFKNLGIQSDEAIEKAKKEIIADFQAIKKSGKASSSDIAKAYKAMDKKIKKLDGISGLEKQIKKSGKGLESFKGKVSKTGKSLAGRAGLASAAVAATVAVKSMIDQTRQLAVVTKEIDLLSARTGFTTQTIQGLSHAATVMGVDVKDMRDGLVDLNFELGEAFKEGGNSEKRFTDLGVTIRNTNGTMKSQEQVLRDVSDALKSIDDPATRAAHVAKIMGEDNQKLLNVLTQGSEGIDRYTQEWKGLGGVLDTETRERLKAVDEGFNTLSQQLQANTQQLTTMIALPVSEFFLDWSVTVKKLGEETGILFKKDTELLQIERELEQSQKDLKKAQDEWLDSLRGGTEEIKKSEEQLKKEAEQLKKTEAETKKYNEQVEKLTQKAKEDLELQGLNDTEKQLKILQQEMDRVIEQYGVDLPKALAVLEGKQRKVLQDQTKNQKAFNDELQNQIDALKIADASGPVGRAELERGIKERELDTELNALKERAKAEGLSDEKISELETLKRAELEDSLRNLNDTTDTAKDSVNDMSKAVRKSSESAEDSKSSTDKMRDRIKEIGESSKQAAGGLSDALAGLDAIGALALERTGFSRSTGATGRGGAGLANDPESLTRVIDTERFFAIQEMLDKVSRGVVEATDAQITRWRAEAERINRERGLGVNIGGGRGSGAIIGERTVNININNDGSLDNMAVESQQQLAQQIAQEVNNSQQSLTGSS